MTRNMFKVLVISLAAMSVVAVPNFAQASIWSKGAKETVKLMSHKFGKEVAEEGVEQVGKRMEKLAVKYGDDALKAARKTGPEGMRAIEKAGTEAEGKTVAKMLAQHGDEALHAVKSSKAVSLVTRYGDDAAEAIVKHPKIAEPVIETYGRSGAAAMRQLSKPQGILLSRIAKKELGQTGRADEILAVICKYGDVAMNFIWNHKGALLVTGIVLNAFLRDPKPYIDGVVALGETVVDGVATVTGKAAEGAGKEIATRANWTWIITFLLGIPMLLLCWKFRLFQRRKPEVKGTQS